MSIVVYMVAMALTTYLVRMIPFTAFRKQLKSQFLHSFLYYIPYTVLGTMTFPAIFYSTGDTVSSTVGTAVALVLAFFNRSLVTVAICACAAAYVTKLIMPLL